MDEPDPGELTFRVGVALDDENAFILAGVTKEDEARIDHSIILIWNAETGWISSFEEMAFGSLCVATEPVAEIVMLGSEGRFLGLGSGERHEEDVVGEEEETVTKIGTVAGRPYVVGMDGLIARRVDTFSWDKINLDAIGRPDLEAIAGVDDNNFVAVGWAGAIVVVEEGVPRFVDGPTNVILTNICIGGDGYYYACGQRGMLLRGRGDIWEQIAVDETDENLWSVAWFQGELVIATILANYRLTQEGKLELFKMDGASVSSAYNLHVQDDRYMLCVGARDIAFYDGEEWDNLV